MVGRTMIGVVIPTLNESDTLPALLQDLRKLAEMLPLDVVVADGGSSEDTRARALAAGSRVVEVARGRG
jgi:glucosyl-3-phosphoglycerate synthase